MVGNGEVTEVPTEGTEFHARKGKIGDRAKIMCKRQKLGIEIAELVWVWLCSVLSAECPPSERVRKIRRCGRVGGSCH